MTSFADEIVCSALMAGRCCAFVFERRWFRVRHRGGHDDPDQQLRLIAEHTQGEIALTCDVDGCRLRASNQSMALPARAVQVVDTSGAGDSFNGAYLAARLRGLTALEAATAGMLLASRVVSLPGAIIPR